MLKSGQNRPSTAGNTKKPLDKGDWRENEREVIFSSNQDGSLNFIVAGGADLGEFAYVSNVITPSSSVNFTSGNLHDGDLILEVQGQQVSGYTQRDVVAWLNHCAKNGNPVTLKVVTAGTFTVQLREFLNTRYPKGSPAHELQNTIRDNVYLRTVPVTTREPRDGEVNGLDYLFLSLEEFTALERSGNLLESGIYEGNHYGTPKPSREPAISSPQNNSVNGNVNWFMPGAHPSSEGKRKRNRSNVEAMSSKGMEPNGGDVPSSAPNNNSTSFMNCHNDVERSGNRPLPGYNGDGLDCDENADLGSLPSNWEKAYTEKGEVYFIDHNTGTSHWLDPRLSKFQKKSLEECLDDELPYGWERIEDPHYGTYYIDHVNRRTQYENPVLLAKRGGTLENDQENLSDTNENYPSYMKTGSESGSQKQALEPYHPPGFDDQPFFTRNPRELRGERITTVLVKSSRGLGFTIVGGDENVEEFLQIKSVVPNGPAWLDGKLKTGDVLVYVNETCLLGFTHHDMVNVFQSIAPGETVKLEVCRGYPLPFDPNDPNTEVVTTVAVNAPELDEKRTLFESSVDGTAAHHMRSNSDDMLNNSVKSMPDLCSTEKIKNMQRPNSTDVLLDDSAREPPEIPEKPEFLSISIVKGPMGFGFTIADSAYGQKVKKILDRIRCKNLQEGDILVEINNSSVRNMCHSDVVQVLKDCERNHEATVTVQRGSSSPVKNRMKTDFSIHAPGMAMYRSKTPTADLYSTQQKEVMPNRPKTPLVDTRTRSKTPILHTWNNEDVKFNSSMGGMFKLASSQEHFLNERLANVSMNEQKSIDHSGYYSKNSPYPLNPEDAHNLSPGAMDGTDGYPKSSPGYPHPQLGYYNGYVDEYPVYDPLYGRSGHPPQVYYHYDRLVDGYVTSHHKDTSPRFPPMVKTLSGLRNQPAYEYVETIVSLVRQETGFGFRIVGGTEEGSQVGATVSIGHIVPGGAADLDGRLCTGDEILSVDGQSVINTSHHHVVQLMGKAAVNGSVAIGIRRRIATVPSDGQGSLCSPAVYPYDVTVTRREDEGFGFVIISSLNRSGSTIGRIIKGSPAERCGQLHVGDHILAVNHIDIITLHHGDIVNLIKDSGFSVTLTIGPPFDETSSNASITHREEYDEDQYDMSRRGGTRSGTMNNLDYPPSTMGVPSSAPSNDSGHMLEAEDQQYHAVELSRGSRGFGFSIRGGKEFHNMPLYVLQIAENGPAAVNDKLKIGDQIIEINGINTKNMTHAEAIEIIRKGGPTVRLLVRRGEKPPPPPPPEY